MIELQARSVIYTLRHLLMPQIQNNVRRLGSMPENFYRGLKFGLDICISARVGSADECARQSRALIDVLIVGDQNAFVGSKDFGSHAPTEWFNVGNHDSCWIDSIDTELNKIYFDLCSSVSNTMAPALMRQQSWFSSFTPIEYVEVQMTWDDERNEQQGSQYWRNIKSIRKISQLEFAAYAYTK